MMPLVSGSVAGNLGKNVEVLHGYQRRASQAILSAVDFFT